MRTKRILLSLFVTPALLLMFPQSVSASSYVSGPSGTKHDGVFLTSAHILFSVESLQQPPGTTSYGGGSFTHGSCDIEPDSCWFDLIQGTHSYKIYENEYGDLYYSIDGSSPGKMAGWGIWDSTVYKILYRGAVTVDINKPTLQLVSPQNNTNTTADSVEVSGQASDPNDSGVAYVEVNSSKISVSPNGHFSAQTKLVNGLNTIEAYAVDNAGRKSDITKVTVFKAESTPPSNSSNIGNTQSSNPNTGEDQQQPSGKVKPAKDSPKDVGTPAVISSTKASSHSGGRSTLPLILIVAVVLLCIIGILVKSGIVNVNFNTKKSSHLKN